MSNKEKILVCGDVCGNFDKLFKRVNQVHNQNGPFSMVLCVGEFFSPTSNVNSLHSLKYRPEIPTFVLGPTQSATKELYPDLKGCELAENIIYLGPSGMYPCGSGLNIVYVSGMESSDASAGFSIEPKDIKSLISSVDRKQTVDILITNQWPKSVWNYAVEPEGVEKLNSSELLAYLAYKIKPRYHFSASGGVYFERLPYRNHKVLQEAVKPASRFIGLSSIGNSKKLKWLYAFNMVPASHMSEAELKIQPSDVTENPYPEELILKNESRVLSKESGSQFFYDMSALEGNGKRKYDGQGKGRGAKQQKPAGPCWFCLSSTEVEKHLVVSVGTHCYLALAKGGLVASHLLILPIEHYQSTPDLEEDCLKEIESFKKSLTHMYGRLDQYPVFFERNYKSQHLQIQVVPVAKKLVPLLEESFKDTAESMGLEMEEVPRHSDATHLAKSGMPFFYVELPSKVKLFHRIRKGFPLQFAREILASPPMLNLPDRVDWRECKISVEDETKLRNSIRDAFKPFDFTLQDSDGDEDM